MSEVKIKFLSSWNYAQFRGMNPKYYIGIDISQLTLDVAVMEGTSILSQHKIENQEKAIAKLITELKKLHGCTIINSFYCAEQMGIYATYLSKVCFKKKLKICFESTLQIKRSMGIQRGKTDAADAIRIAQYAAKNFKTLRLWQPPSPIIEKLKQLSSLRKRLLKLKVMAAATKKLESHYLEKKEAAAAAKYLLATTIAIADDLKRVEEEIAGTIESDSHLNGLLQLITSVPGIGKVIGCQLIIQTNGFESSWTAKKFASYCGIAPFEWSSGTSVKGRTKVSKLASKEVKSNLHLAALGLIQIKGRFIHHYYTRKVMEGKSKMSVLNAIRNKMIHRVFACVRDNRYYIEPKIG